MSFVEFLQDDPQLTREQVMTTVIQVADELDMPDKRGACIVTGMAIDQEVGVQDNDTPARRFWCPANHADEESFNYPHDSISDDGRSCGYLQQQKSAAGDLWWGPTSSEMDLHSSVTMFMQRLKAAGYNASNAGAANDSAQAIQGSGFPNAYGQWWSDINALYDEVFGTTTAVPPIKAVFAPFPEHNIIDGNCCESRNGAAVRYLVLHTEEGKMLGQALDQWMDQNEVSYHYAVDLPTGEAWDLVDTDLASWSVLAANDYTINYVFAGSYAAMSRAEWLANDAALQQMAYLVAQDAKKYDIPPIIRVGNNASGYMSLPNNDAVTDHKGITDGLHIGDHQDVGPGFPWDVFNTYLQQYFNGIEEDVMTPEQWAFLQQLGPKIDRIFFELTNAWNSASVYAGPNETPNPGNTLVGVALALDGQVNAEYVEDLAREGDAVSIGQALRTAAGEGLYGTDPRAIARATFLLNELRASGVLATYEAAQK